MKRHHLFLLIFLTVASISASATCLYDGGKGTTPPNPKTAPETTRDIETVPIIISCDDDKVVPIVPHDYLEPLALAVEVKTDLFARQMEIIYGFGLGEGVIELRNTRTMESYRGIITPESDRFLINPSVFKGQWIIGIYVLDSRGESFMYFGGFEYRGGRW